MTNYRIENLTNNMYGQQLSLRFPMWDNGDYFIP